MVSHIFRFISSPKHPFCSSKVNIRHLWLKNFRKTTMFFKTCIKIEKVIQGKRRISYKVSEVLYISIGTTSIILKQINKE